MAVESPLRRFSPEFWAIVATAVTLLVALVGNAALNLTVAGWIREDMRSMDARIVSLDVRLSGDINELASKVADLDKRLAVVESHVLDARGIVQADPSDKT